MLNLTQLQTAVAAAKRRFALIRKKYPELKAYIVLSLPVGQTGIDSSPTQILHEFPAMVIDDAAKASLLNLRSRQSETKTGPEVDRRMREQMDQLASQLTYDEKCHIEIRFNDLNYDLVWKLRADDDLVDRNLTPQTRASIRIVLGTLAHFDETQSRQPQ